MQPRASPAKADYQNIWTLASHRCVPLICNLALVGQKNHTYCDIDPKFFFWLVEQPSSQSGGFSLDQL